MAVVFDKIVCDEVREKFNALADTSKYYEADVERIKTDDVYVSRFLTHQKEVRPLVLLLYTYYIILYHIDKDM